VPGPIPVELTVVVTLNDTVSVVVIMDVTNGMTTVCPGNSVKVPLTDVIVEVTVEVVKPTDVIVEVIIDD
jgi:hypothetical protein